MCVFVAKIPVINFTCVLVYITMCLCWSVFVCVLRELHELMWVCCVCVFVWLSVCWCVCVGLCVCVSVQKQRVRMCVC